MSAKVQPQYRIFFSWQSDNKDARDMLEAALKEVIKDFKIKGIAIEKIEGGGGFGFISIEDAVRMKIQSCDLFVGDITPVGNVALKEKLLPNANVMYEMGIASECLNAEQIVAVAAEGEWDFKDMPFDFNHNTFLKYNPSKKDDSLKRLAAHIESRIKSAKEKSVHINRLYFADWLIDKNIASGKYLPDTFLEDRDLKDKVRCFVMPSVMYQVIFDRLNRMSFAMYDKYMARKGKHKPFTLNLKDYNLTNKSFDLPLLRKKVERLSDNLSERITFLDKDGNKGWRAASKVKNQAERVKLMNSRFLVVKSDAGKGKTNFLCDIVRNVLKPNIVPYVFVNAYELSADRIAQSIALEHNYIGNGSLEDVLLHIERFCQQHRKYMLVVIDGLNEHPHQKLFIRNLTRVLKAVSGYEHVKVLMSCRRAFFDNNYATLRKVFGNDLVEQYLGSPHGRNKLSASEQECIIERYKNHFEVKGEFTPNVQKEFVGNLLLMRLFFETHQDKDLGVCRLIDRDDTYSKYFELMKREAYKILEESSTSRLSDDIVEKLVFSIIQWMLDNDTIKNVPTKKLVATLTDVEQKCFDAFINSNLLIQIDNPENEEGTDEVINFSFEDVRDYLITRYLITLLSNKKKGKYDKYIRKYTDESSNLAEGLRHYLFLIARNTNNQKIIDSIKGLDWFDDTRLYGIWEVRNDKLTNEDVEFIKSKLPEHPKLIGRMLAVSRWNSAVYPILNINDLLNVLDSMPVSERIKLLDEIWSKDYNVRMAKYGDMYRSECYQYVKMVRKFVVNGYKEGRKDLQPLEHLLRYFTDKQGELIGFVTAAMRDIEEARKAGRVEGKKNGNLFVPGFYQYDIFSYLMPVRDVTREDFLKSAGVRGGYASEMFGGLYDAIFTEAEDVVALYNTYYSKEYPTLEQFITMHYCIPMPTVEALVSVLKTEGNRIIDFNSIDYGNDSVDQFVISEEMFDRFYGLLKYKENEDKD